MDIPDDLYRRLKAPAALDEQAIVRLVAREIQGASARGRSRLALIKGKESPHQPADR